MAMLFRAAASASRIFFFAGMGLIAAIFVIVVYDVTMRNAGFTPPYWGVNTVEYALFWIAMLTIPDLVRTRGHVSVEVVLAALAPAARARLSSAVSIFAALLCFFMTWRAGLAFTGAWMSGNYEVRAFDMPEWIIYLPMPISFFLAGLMFLRFPLTGESYHAGPAESSGGL
ncbi:TRAP transporter small permease [Microbaculum marinum]|uniref:TRAP transporter small permease protein n=1 Tax=Microbaculum marinum TaxID=1764581 RepID=A0AAW9RPT5_9HYPH